MNNRQIVTCFNKNENPPEKKRKTCLIIRLKKELYLGRCTKITWNLEQKKSVLRWKRKKSSVSFRKMCVKGRFDNVAEKHYQMFVICRTFSMSKAMNANVVLLRILFFIRLWYFNDVFHYDVSFFSSLFHWYKFQLIQIADMLFGVLFGVCKSVCFLYFCFSCFCSQKFCIEFRVMFAQQCIHLFIVYFLRNSFTFVVCVPKSGSFISLSLLNSGNSSLRRRISLAVVVCVCVFFLLLRICAHKSVNS